MEPTGPAPGDRRAAAVSPWVIPPAAVALGTLIAVLATGSGGRTAVGWTGGFATLVVALVSLVVDQRSRTLAALRAEHAGQEAAARRRLTQHEAETARLAALLPEAVQRLQKGEFAEDILEGVRYDPALAPEFRAAHEAALRAVVDAIQNAEDLRESAERGFVNIARRVQAIIHQQAQSLREMEQRHGQDHAVFADLLKLDHGTALVGRLADSIAVLGGDRPGRQWGKSVPLYSVLRGAMSRIIDYQRVELHPVSEVAVVGPAVEPLIHALAELLDNATRYSPPQTKVHLTAVEVQSGIAIEIEDGGVGLSEEAHDRAERMLREAQAGIDLHDLGETPRLGLAVVGRLAQAYDLTVSLRSSAYGGVRAVLIVPQALVTATPATGAAHGIGTASGPRPLEEAGSGRRRKPGPQASPPVEAGVDPSANGLPQRRRRSAVAAPATDTTEPSPAAGTAAPAATATAPQPDETSEPGLWLGEFTDALAGRDQAPDVPAQQSGDESTDERDKRE
ncbi:ATP-binding protein [Streptomyces sp. NPDC051940]|uniref:sensor histidine kinase n=1 Tax=Streptomyces sp. NPDC051940 TaxID=3155675 RepID=UPI0034344E54